MKDSELPNEIQREFELKWRLGVRTAALITRLACKFTSTVVVFFGDDQLDGKSVLDWMMASPVLADIETQVCQGLRGENGNLMAGARLRVATRGPDAVAAMGALSELFTCGARVDRCVQSACPSTAILIGYTADVIEYACSNGHSWKVSRGDGTSLRQA